MINFWFSKHYMTGGNIYNHMAYEAIRENFETIQKKKAYSIYNGPGHTYLNFIYTALFLKSHQTDIDIMDYRVATWCTSKFRGKRIVIFFHFDTEETPKKKNIYIFLKDF